MIGLDSVKKVYLKKLFIMLENQIMMVIFILLFRDLLVLGKLNYQKFMLKYLLNLVF